MLVELLVQAVLAYAIAPGITYWGAGKVLKFAFMGGQKPWVAVTSAAYTIVAVIFGLAEGAAGGETLAQLVPALASSAWILRILGAAISVALSILAILAVNARYRPATME